MYNKILFQCYDPKVKESPFKFITLQEVEDNNIPKEEIWSYLGFKAIKLGYTMKCWGIDFDKQCYTVTVYNYDSPGSCEFDINHLERIKI